MKTWLVLDVHYLCHRAFHTAKGLSWKGKPTGVIFGFLKSIAFLKDELQSDNVAFCFEHPHLFRRDVYPGYKLRRRTREKTEEEKQSYNELTIQISELHKRYLPKIGFKNIFCYHGMESDDIMAAIALNCPPDEEVILVTADSDMFQCLRPNVSIYSPQKKKFLTCEWFVKRYRIHPSKWAVVKALSGCVSDEVKGVPRIGEITALSYLRGDLLPGTSYHNAIVSDEGKAIVRRNRKLVQLPYEGCPVPSLQDDKVSKEGWREVCDLLGMKSIAGRLPILEEI